VSQAEVYGIEVYDERAGEVSGGDVRSAADTAKGICRMGHMNIHHMTGSKGPAESVSNSELVPGPFGQYFLEQESLHLR
jgi:hypothetical protein